MHGADTNGYGNKGEDVILNIKWGRKRAFFVFPKILGWALAAKPWPYIKDTLDNQAFPAMLPCIIISHLCPFLEC